MPILAILYSRGFCPGWLAGINHRDLVDGRYDNHHGWELGRVVKVTPQAVIISAQRELQKGDGLLFVDFARHRELGGFVYQVAKLKNGIWKIGLANNVKTKQITPGQTVYLNASAKLARNIQQSYTNKANFKKIPVTIKVSGQYAQPLTVSYYTSDGQTVT